MGDIQPWASNGGWADTQWNRCDQAAAQLLWEMKNKAGPVGECMDHVTGAGSNGLNTVVTLAASPTSVCPGDTVIVSGSLKVATNSNYGRMSGDPLGARLVTIKRDGFVAAQPLTNSTTGTFSVAISAGGSPSDTLVASFANEGTEALTGDTSSTVTITVLGSPPWLASSFAPGSRSWDRWSVSTAESRTAAPGRCERRWHVLTVGPLVVQVAVAPRPRPRVVERAGHDRSGRGSPLGRPSSAQRGGPGER